MKNQEIIIETKTVCQDMIFTYFKKRMKEKKVTQNKLAEILGVSVTTLIRYFKKQTPMPLCVYLEICVILEIIPYLKEREAIKLM